MDGTDDSENTAKVSDSAYSCSKSQSRRSHSSKSTHSGSHSSGSSGYGGKPSTLGSSLGGLHQGKRDKGKNGNKKSHQLTETTATLTALKQESQITINDTKEARTLHRIQEDDSKMVERPNLPPLQMEDRECESMDVAMPDIKIKPECIPEKIGDFAGSNGFSCVISMLDGVVMYTTATVTSCLGFPRDMWIGRSFIDFIHPKDRSTFASQIMNGVAFPKNLFTTEVNNSVLIMCCRIRTYRGLAVGYAVKNRNLAFLPFALNLTFKELVHDEAKTMFLVVQASPFTSAFKERNETVKKPTPFITRHIANGKIQYIDRESVPYLGYLPQDVMDKNILHMYHPDDLEDLQQSYDDVVRERKYIKTKPYRLQTHNGEYIKVVTELSCIVNPWSKNLEYICGKHFVLEGPNNPDVFQLPCNEKSQKLSEEQKYKIYYICENISKILNDISVKAVESAKQQTSERCMGLAAFMETLVEERSKPLEELRLEIHVPDHSFFEPDSEMLGGISPHHENDSKSSSEAPLSYNQLNYNETLQRYFDSYQPSTYEEYKTTTDFAQRYSEAQPGRDLNPSGYGKKARHMPPFPNESDFDTRLLDCSMPSPPSRQDFKQPDYSVNGGQALLLTETYIMKHNEDMEKILMRKHKEARTSSRGAREKVNKENRQMKMDHLTRCNAPYQPTLAETNINNELHDSSKATPQGLKRPSCGCEPDVTAHKHRCSWAIAHSNSSPPQYLYPTPSAPAISRPATMSQTASMNTHPIMSPAATAGPISMYNLPGGTPTVQMAGSFPTVTTAALQKHTIPYVMYPQAVFGAPIMYSALSQPVAASSIQRWMEPRIVSRLKQTRDIEIVSSHSDEEFGDYGSLSLSSGKISFNANTEIRLPPGCSKYKKMDIETSDNMTTSKTGSEGQVSAQKTDGESSYSSFCSSFFKTESGSTDESDNKNRQVIGWRSQPNQAEVPRIKKNNEFMNFRGKKVNRKNQPPWMDKVCVTSELVYKYQVMPKNVNEVLKSDKDKIKTLEQPFLVNEQLSQLYLDLQLGGAPTRLTLEEGFTSSASSGEETLNAKLQNVKKPSKRREYSRLVMIYEEDAPLPPPEDSQPTSTQDTLAVPTATFTRPNPTTSTASPRKM